MTLNNSPEHFSRDVIILSVAWHGPVQAITFSTFQISMWGLSLKKYSIWSAVTARYMILRWINTSATFTSLSMHMGSRLFPISTSSMVSESTPLAKLPVTNAFSRFPILQIILSMIWLIPTAVWTKCEMSLYRG